MLVNHQGCQAVSSSSLHHGSSPTTFSAVSSAVYHRSSPCAVVRSRTPVVQSMRAWRSVDPSSAAQLHSSLLLDRPTTSSEVTLRRVGGWRTSQEKGRRLKGCLLILPTAACVWSVQPMQFSRNADTESSVGLAPFAWLSRCAEPSYSAGVCSFEAVGVSAIPDRRSLGESSCCLSPRAVSSGSRGSLLPELPHGNAASTCDRAASSFRGAIA